MTFDSSQQSRRRFLMGATQVAGAMAAPYFVPSSALASDNRPGANDRIVLGVIGMGQRGNQLLANIPASGSVAAICDADSRKSSTAVAKHQADWKVYQDYRKMLDQRDLDAVIVCPTDHHHVLEHPGLPGRQRCLLRKATFALHP